MGFFWDIDYTYSMLWEEICVMTWGSSDRGRQQCSAQRLISHFSFLFHATTFLLSPWYTLIIIFYFFIFYFLFFYL